MMAAADEIEIHIDGRGGHGAHPHLTVDPVLVAGAHHHRAADHRQPQREPARRRRGQPVLDADQPARRVQRDPARRRAGRHGAHLQRRDARPRRAAAHRDSCIVDRRGVRRDRDAQVRARLSRPPSTPTREAEFAARVAERAVRHEQRRARSRAVDGRARISPSCCRSGPAPTCGSGRAAPKAAASCTTRSYDFNDEVIPLGAGYLAALAEAALPLNAAAHRRDEPGGAFRGKLRRSARQVSGGCGGRGRERCPPRASDRPRRRRRGIVDRPGDARRTRRAGSAADHFGHAWGRRILRFRLPGRAASRRRIPRRRRPRGRSRADAACAEPLWLFASAPGQRGQRRPQPQFHRLQSAAAGQCGVRGNPFAVAAANRGRRRSTASAGSGAWVAAHGPAAYQAAVSGGQYRFADGMFYGGAAPAWSNRVLRAVLREHAASRSALGWIDFHTGLGPRGHGEKIYAGGNVAADIARTKAWWGDEVTSYFDGTSTSASLTGVNGYAAYDECPHAEFAGMALEYGTCPIEQVLQALRAEHWLHNHPEASRLQRCRNQACDPRRLLYRYRRLESPGPRAGGRRLPRRDRTACPGVGQRLKAHALRRSWRK